MEAFPGDSTGKGRPSGALCATAMIKRLYFFKLKQSSSCVEQGSSPGNHGQIAYEFVRRFPVEWIRYFFLRLISSSIRRNKRNAIPAPMIQKMGAHFSISPPSEKQKASLPSGISWPASELVAERATF
jgi:hypothetical protein